MILLVVNAGSSSLKFSLYNMLEEQLLIKGLFERINLEASSYTITYNSIKYSEKIDLPNHLTAVDILVKKLIELKIIKSIDEIKIVGHRIVHGGNTFLKPTLVDDKVIKELEGLAPLAPVHNKGGVMGIIGVTSVIKNSINVCVFDTTFHQSIKEEQYLYPVPKDWYTKHNVRKYGFHGISHRYLSEYVDTNIGSNKNIITCHLGNGASISAIKNGVCIDTSMGFTPLAGVMMGTRCGDIDPSIISYISNKLNISVDKVNNILNYESGIKGISGIGSDFRDILKGYANNDSNCILTMNMFVERIVNYISMYYVKLGSVDGIIFTGGIGENVDLLRQLVIDKLTCLNIKLDTKKNKETIRKFGKISSENSSVEVYVIPTNEEIIIAQDAYNLVKEKDYV